MARLQALVLVATLKLSCIFSVMAYLYHICFLTELVAKAAPLTNPDKFFGSSGLDKERNGFSALAKAIGLREKAIALAKRNLFISQAENKNKASKGNNIHVRNLNKETAKHCLYFFSNSASRYFCNIFSLIMECITL